MPGSVLLIAFHFPPCGVSSGLQRTLALARHLDKHGWHPTVLSVQPRAYEQVSSAQLNDIPGNVQVRRTWALDATHAFSVKGRYWSRLTVPDRWANWWLSAVPAGLQLIRSRRIDLIWSTYPIATAHRIASTLSRMSGLPWVADFRDPMVEQDPLTGEWTPGNPALRNARLRIERDAARHARKLVFCTDSARNIVLDRYPDVAPGRCHVVSNGYDESVFADAEQLASRAPASSRKVLLHSGTVYISPDRDPKALFGAIRKLSQNGTINAGNFELRLRNPSNPDYFQRLAASEGIADLVSVLPSINYRESLAEMLSAEGLLVLQGFTSNPAVPAKLYEYLRAGRPVVALVHPEGESAKTLRSVGLNEMASLTDSDAIAELLSNWVSSPTDSTSFVASRSAVSQYSREALTAQTAKVLDEVQ